MDDNEDKKNDSTQESISTILGNNCNISQESISNSDAIYSLIATSRNLKKDEVCLKILEGEAKNECEKPGKSDANCIESKEKFVESKETFVESKETFVKPEDICIKPEDIGVKVCNRVKSCKETCVKSLEEIFSELSEKMYLKPSEDNITKCLQETNVNFDKNIGVKTYEKSGIKSEEGNSHKPLEEKCVKFSDEISAKACGATSVKFEKICQNNIYSLKETSIPIKVSEKSGLKASEEAGIKVSEESGNKVSEESDLKVSEESGLKVSEKSGLKVSEKSGLKVSEESGLKVSKESGLKFSEKSGLKVSEKSGFKISEKSGLKVSEEFGLKVSEESGLKVSEESGLKVSDESGLKVSEESGLTVSEESGLTVSEESGLTVSKESGLTVSKESGLKVSRESGLKVSKESDLKVSEKSGLKVSEKSGLKVSEKSGLKVSEKSGLKVSEESGLKVSKESVLKVFEESGLKVSEESGLKVSEESGLKVAEKSGLKVFEESGLKVFEESGLKVFEESGLKVFEESGIKVSEESGIKVSEESDLKVSEKSGLKVSEESGLKVSEEFGLKVSEEFGLKVSEESGLKVSEESGLKVSRESGLKVSEKSGLKVSEKSGLKASEESGLKVSEESGIKVSEESGIKVSEESDLKVSEKSGLKVSEESGLKVSRESGLKVSEKSGLKVSEKSGLKASEESGLKVSEESGIKVSEESGIKVSEESDLKVSEKSGLKVSEESGLKVSEESGLKVSEEFGLKVSEESGLKVSEESGLKVSRESGLKVSRESGLKVSEESGLNVSEESGLKASEESGLKVSEESGLKVSEESGIKVSEESGIKVSEESDLKVSEKSGLKVSEESGLKVSEEFGLKVSEEFGLKVSEESGLKVSRESGLKVSRESGLKVSRESGLKVSRESGLKVSRESGLKVSRESGLKVSEESGLKVSEESGLNVSEESGLKVSEESGLKVSEESGLKVSEESGIKLSEESGIKFSEKTRAEKTGIDKVSTDKYLNETGTLKCLENASCSENHSNVNIMEIKSLDGLGNPYHDNSLNTKEFENKTLNIDIGEPVSSESTIAKGQEKCTKLPATAESIDPRIIGGLSPKDHKKHFSNNIIESLNLPINNFQHSPKLSSQVELSKARTEFDLDPSSIQPDNYNVSAYKKEETLLSFADNNVLNEKEYFICKENQSDDTTYENSNASNFIRIQPTIMNPDRNNVNDNSILNTMKAVSSGYNLQKSEEIIPHILNKKNDTISVDVPKAKSFIYNEKAIADSSQDTDLESADNVLNVSVNIDATDNDTIISLKSYVGDKDQQEIYKREILIPITLEYDVERTVTPNASLVNKTENTCKELAEEGTKDIENLFDITLSPKFDWDSFLENTNQEPTPSIAFLHVEQSIGTGIEDGQYLEVIFKDPECSSSSKIISYWPAKVISSCGLLLRLHYEKFPKQKETEFWCDLSSTQRCNLKTIGWSSENHVELKPPPSLNLLFSEEGIPTLDESSFKNYPGVCKEVFENDRSEEFSRIFKGDLLEVLDANNASEGIVATVVKNNGGHLLLKSTEADEDENLQRLFYLDPRVKPFNWIKEHPGIYRYRSSVNYEELRSKMSDDVFERCSTYLATLLRPRLPSKHLAKEGMCLEAIHPKTFETIHCAEITEIIDDYHFVVSIEEERIITSIDNPNLLKVNFCLENDLKLFPFIGYDCNFFCWEDYMKSKNSSALPLSTDSEISAIDLGFEIGQMLEVVDKQRDATFCPGTIVNIFHRTLNVKISSDERKFLVFKDARSTDLFPVGYATSHGFSIMAHESLVSSDIVNEPSSPKVRTIEIKEEEKVQCKSPESRWCDRLFINHYCSAGPYLSKSKVSKLSQSIGPGPVSLVLAEILGQTITAGYIPTRVLRELQHVSSGKNNPSWKSITLKAKFKRHLLKISVKVPVVAREVESYLVELSKCLLCCNNLWAFKLSGENCPSKCNGVNYGPTGNVIMRGRPTSKRKRGPKKRLLDPLSKSADVPGNTEETERPLDEEEDEEEDLSGSDSASRPSSPMIDVLQKKQKRLLTSLEIHMNEIKSEGRPSKRSLESQESSSPLRKKSKVEKGVNPTKDSYFFPPADVATDPLSWSVSDVESYVLNQPSICHHAVKLREHEVDGRALLLLNLPTLVHYLRLPHSCAVILAQHICQIKLAHFVKFSS